MIQQPVLLFIVALRRLGASTSARKKLRRPKAERKLKKTIGAHLSAGNGILKTTGLTRGVRLFSVQRVKRESAGQLVGAA